MEENFRGKKVLVTGAGAGIVLFLFKCLSEFYFNDDYLGIGRSLCIKLHRMGVVVYALSRTKATLETLQAECPGMHVIQQDIANWDETRKKIEVLPLISMLVNNAG
jgi:NAD(P)-dependent dehydrogenase (short-subunit alcohol dehydrogenase family)